MLLASTTNIQGLHHQGQIEHQADVDNGDGKVMSAN